MKKTTETIIDHKKAPHEQETRAVRYLPILELDQVTLAFSYLPRARKPDAYIAIYTPTNQAAKLRDAIGTSVEKFYDVMLNRFGSMEAFRVAIIEQMKKKEIIKE